MSRNDCDQRECDPILVADDDGEILTDGERDREREAMRCSTCGERFGREAAAAATFDGDVARYVCPNCGRTVEGPPPS